MPFETFNKRQATSSKTPMVTIQMRGGFSFNKAAYDLLGSPEALELLYDRENKLIGFRASDSSNPLAYPVKEQGRGSTGKHVAGQAFTKYYDIDTSVARRFTVEMQGDILVLDLKSEGIVVTGPRAAMKSRLGAQ